MDNRILLIRGGGTIESVAYSDPKHPPPHVETLKGAASLVMPTIAMLRGHARVDGFSWTPEEEGLYVKDSQYYSAENIRKLAELIRNDSHDYFILTHGSDAVVKNALLLESELMGSGKTAALVAAIVPLSMRQSDGVVALEFALDGIADRQPGVYVVGRDATSKRLTFFNPAQVQKERDASLADGKLIFTENGRQT